MAKPSVTLCETARLRGLPEYFYINKKVRLRSVHLLGISFADSFAPRIENFPNQIRKGRAFALPFLYRGNRI